MFIIYDLKLATIMHESKHEIIHNFDLRYLND